MKIDFWGHKRKKNGLKKDTAIVLSCYCVIRDGGMCKMPGKSGKEAFSWGKRGRLGWLRRKLLLLEITTFALEALNIDKFGLDDMDNKILLTIIDKFKGGPVGLTTIATAVSEDPGTLEEVYEPFLIKEGFLKRTPRGREVTDLAYKHLRKNRRTDDWQATLF